MIPMWIDLLGHFGYLISALGLILLSRKNIWGWIFRLVGEAVWVVIGILLGMSAIWSWGLLFLSLDIYGFYSWRKENT